MTVWIRNIQPCILELRMYTDYAGQPLIFTKPGTPRSRRCVTEEVSKADLVQQYVKRQILEIEGVKAATPAAPTPEKAPEPAPVVVAEPVVESAPEPVVESDPEPEPAAAVEAEEVPEVKEETNPGRKKRGRKRGS